jgi:uncharacterized protein (DUF2141 family)
MAFISVSGTGFAGPILALAVLIAPSVASTQATNSATVAVDVSGLRNARGQLLVCVTANAAAFPDCSRDPHAVKAQVAVGTLHAGTPMRMAVPATGTYAVAIVHDENGNGRMDTTLGLPREGFGFSRNPAIRFGPPRFSSAAFPVTADGATQGVRMRYML